MPKDRLRKRRRRSVFLAVGVCKNICNMGKYRENYCSARPQKSIYLDAGTSEGWTWKNPSSKGQEGTEGTGEGRKGQGQRREETRERRKKNSKRQPRQRKQRKLLESRRRRPQVLRKVTERFLKIWRRSPLPHPRHQRELLPLLQPLARRIWWKDAGRMLLLMGSMHLLGARLMSLGMVATTRMPKNWLCLKKSRPIMSFWRMFLSLAVMCTTSLAWKIIPRWEASLFTLMLNHVDRSPLGSFCFAVRFMSTGPTFLMVCKRSWIRKVSKEPLARIRTVVAAWVGHASKVCSKRISAYICCFLKPCVLGRAWIYVISKCVHHFGVCLSRVFVSTMIKCWHGS